MKKVVSIALILLSFSFASATWLNAQNFVYQFDLLSYFDNREYDADFQRSQTLFATRLSPELGFQLQDNAGHQHTMILGAHYTQSMGKALQISDFVPTLYYRFHPVQSCFHLYLGAIPYRHLSQDLPAYVLYDSIAYTHPNIQGALLQFQDEQGYFDLACDWRSMQTEENREAFRLFMQGDYRWGFFHAGGIVQMNHLASRKFQKNGVCDDAFINPVLGFDLPWLDSLIFQTGYIWAYQWDRIRSAEPILSESLLFNLQANWKRLGLRNSLYVGKNLQPLYPKNGNALYLGDPFYQSSFYNRCDVYLYLLRNNFVNCLFSWNLHYTKEFGIDHQQQLICRFSTEGLRQNKLLRNIFGK